MPLTLAVLPVLEALCLKGFSFSIILEKVFKMQICCEQDTIVLQRIYKEIKNFSIEVKKWSLIWIANVHTHTYTKELWHVWLYSLFYHLFL